MQENISIHQVTHITPQLVEDFTALVAQLGPAYPFIASAEKLVKVILCPTNTLLIASNQQGKAM